MRGLVGAGRIERAVVGDDADRLTLDAGQEAWTEEPGFIGTREALAMADVRAVPVPIDASGFSPERVARTCLDTNDRGGLYCMPQPDARIGWGIKRFTPTIYTRAAGLTNRVTQ